MLFRTTLSELFRMALPMVVSQGALALMMFADRFFLSRLSATHVAASMGGGVSFWVCLCFFNALAAYGNAIVAQYFGRRDYGRCSLVVTQGAVLSLASLPVLERQWGESNEWFGGRVDLYQIQSATLESGVLDNTEVLDELSRINQPI